MEHEQLVWSFRAQVIGIIIALCFLTLVINLVKKKKLLEEYSVLWLFCSIGILVLASWKGLLLKITSICGATDTTSILFFFGIIFFLMLLLHFSVKVTKLVNHVRNISQRLAIMDEEHGSRHKNSRFSGQVDDEQNEPGT